MSEVIKIGPLWNRVVLDGKSRVVKHRGRTICRLEDIGAFRVRELIAEYEAIELLNTHPDVQKAHRGAELWLELKNGKNVLTATIDQAGLLISDLSALAATLNIPVKTERKRIDE